MALWSSGVLWSSLATWGPSAPPSGPTQRNAKVRTHTHMKHNKFYPRSVAQRPEWHTNLAAKLLQYGPTLGLSTTQVNNGVADNLYLAYGLGDWINNVREFAPSCTAILKTLSTGTGGEAFVFTPYVAPALPTLPVGHGRQVKHKALCFWW